MQNFLRTILTALLAITMVAGPVSAQSANDFKTTFKNGMRVEGGLTVVDSGLTVSAGGLTVSSGAVAVPSLTATTPIVNASIGNGAKRQILQFVVNGGGTCADSTTYSCLLVPGRAGIVKAVNFVAATPPVGGTDTLLVKKGSSSGNTMLDAASVDATGLSANTVLAGTLTGTAADLAVTATQPIYVAYSAGAQTTDAVGVTIQVEFEPNDF